MSRRYASMVFSASPHSVDRYARKSKTSAGIVDRAGPRGDLPFAAFEDSLGSMVAAKVRRP